MIFYYRFTSTKIHLNIVNQRHKRYFIAVLILFNDIKMSLKYNKNTFVCRIIRNGTLIMELRVKEIIKNKGLTMQEFADNLGITRDTLTRNINGNPTVDTLDKIAKALSVDITELFTASKNNNSINGYIEVNNQLYKINSIDDIKKLLTEIESTK